MPIPEQIAHIFAKLEYEPTDEQWAVHNSDARIRQVAGGERSGKSYSAAMDTIPRIFESTLIWLVAADYERTKAEYNYIQEALMKLGVKYTATKHVDPGEIIVAGTIRINTKSAKDPRRLAMEAPDFILGCEASQLDYETFLRLRGRLAEKKGSMLLSGTFESSLGWYVDMFQRGQSPNPDDVVSFSLPTWTNIRIFPGGRQDPEILALERLHSAEWFMERYGGQPSPPQGLVFREFSTVTHTGIGTMFEYDPTLPVQLWIDPGYQHCYAIEVVQQKGDQIVIVDEVFETGLVTTDMITLCQQKSWWHNVTHGVVDVAARQHPGQPAIVETWIANGQLALRSQKLQIRDGIEVMKTALKVNPITNFPMLLINAKCRGLISELGGCPNPLNGQTRVYKWKMDGSGVALGDKPIDKDNDACKAVAYGLVDMVGYTFLKNKHKSKMRFW